MNYETSLTGLGPAAAAVREDRLWCRLEQLGRIGATPAGGVHRLPLSTEDGLARRQILQWAAARRFACSIDDIGNIFIRRAGLDADAPPVASGSHVDSQPNGGRFDGAYGVLAALEALEAIDDSGVATRRPIEVVIWTAEEGGARYEQGCMGSQVYGNPSKLPRMLALKDSSGESVGQCLVRLKSELPPLEQRSLEQPIFAYIEAHIEQGPVLEEAGKSIGIVTGIQGCRYFQIDVVGEAAHAGTTPRSRRRDALLSACSIVKGLEKLFHDTNDVCRFTVGSFEVQPNAAMVVPERVKFTIDFRHTQESIIQELGDRVADVCEGNAGRCKVTVTETRRASPTEFTGLVTEKLASVAVQHGIAYMRIPSGAGHDARYVAERCPSGMIFIPCLRGISHSPDESVTSEDAAWGARITADALVSLSQC